MQKNPIFHISVDILQNTNFFKAFTASVDVPSIYVQQFWNTLGNDDKTGVYNFQLNELWFNLNADVLCNALEITPKDTAHPFVPPPAGDLIIDFVKGKTSGIEKPRHLILQILWGIVTGTNVDYVELIWEEFMQAIKNFFSDMANIKILTKKPKHHVIPYCRFTKLIIYYLRGVVDEVFRMPIPKDLITDAIRNSEYYKKYLEMAVRKPRQPTTVTDKEGGKKKAPEAGKSGHLVNEKDEESQPATEPQVEDDEYNLQRGIQMSLESFKTPVGGVAIREPDSGITQKLPIVEGNGKGIVSDEQAAQSLLDLQKPKKKGITDQYIFQRRTPTTQDASTGPSAQPQDDTSANVVYDTSSSADSTNDFDNVADIELSTSKADTKILNVDEEHGEEVSNTVALEERTVELDEAQARLDPGKTPEYRPPPECVLIEEDQAGSNPEQSHMAQAGPNPEPMHEDFIAIVYPAVHESLKLTTEEQVHIENPPSSSGTLSSMKNLEDTFTFW
ncbi:hypothetical protein Tco_0839087 [Tanacetum coccineum]|uniref:Monodehydroascorbate reductase n=1 Tax=Tanacetum coccineum TaxID=301880 RepID=A0ABQ5APN4_9ASTR